MATKLPEAGDRRVYDSPLHVAHGADGSVTVFLPDGHRVVLTAEAAERSGAVLWRSGVTQRDRRRRPGRPSRAKGQLGAQLGGQVIAVDFTAHSVHH